MGVSNAADHTEYLNPLRPYTRFLYDRPGRLVYELLCAFPFRSLCKSIPRDSSGEYIEIGCGMGYYTRQVLLRYPKARLTVYDPSVPMTDVLLSSSWYRRHRGRIALERKAFCYEKLAVDGLFSFLTFHYLPDLELAADQIAGSLKAGSWLYIVDFDTSSTTGMHDTHPLHRRWDQEVVKKLLGRSFTSIRCATVRGLLHVHAIHRVAEAPSV